MTRKTLRYVPEEDHTRVNRKPGRRLGVRVRRAMGLAVGAAAGLKLTHPPLSDATACQPETRLRTWNTR